MTSNDSGSAGLPRRHLLRMGIGALAGAGVLGSYRPARAASVCTPTSPLRQCDWTPAPTTDLGRLGKAIIFDNNQYNGGSTVKQLAYWDESYQWSRRAIGGWDFKQKTFGIERAIRIAYIGAKDASDGYVADEHLLIGLDLPKDSENVSLPGGAVTFMTSTTVEPTNPFEKLAWLILKVTSPKDTTIWSGASTWAADVGLDKNGAEWPFRAQKINVEASILIKLFVTRPGPVVERARLLVGYEGSGGW